MGAAGMAHMVYGLAAAASGPLAFVAGAAVFCWLAKRRADANRLREVASFKARVLQKMNAEMRSAQSSAIQSVEEVFTKLRRAGEEAMHAAERKRQKELQDLVDWVSEKKNQSKEDLRVALEAARSNSVVAGRLVQDWQRLRDALIPANPRPTG
jgi:malonyl CoA-acyl carrier protein transacylase